MYSSAGSLPVSAQPKITIVDLGPANMESVLLGYFLAVVVETMMLLPNWGSVSKGIIEIAVHVRARRNRDLGVTN